MARSSPIKQRSKVHKRNLTDHENKYDEHINTEFIDLTYGNEYKTILDGFDITDVVGKGSFGYVFLLEKHAQNPRIIKFQKIPTSDINLNADAEREIILNIFLNEYSDSISPKMFNYTIYQYNNFNIYVYISEKVDTTLYKYLSSNAVIEDDKILLLQEIYRLLYFLCEHQLIHADFHINNIGVNLENNNISKLFLIDWGWGNKLGKCDPCFELSRFYESIFWLRDIHNIHVLENIAISIWEQNCSKKTITNFLKYQQEFWHHQYVDKSKLYTYLNKFK